MSFLLTDPTHPLPLVLVAAVGGYLSGSVPYGLLLSKMAGAGDIRKSGSGNIGATNVLRVVGKKVAAATLVLDALKGFVPVAVAGAFHQDYAILAAFGAFFGHLFPVWLKFKGGKGVATALGVCFGFSWMLGASLCGIWLFMAGVTQYSSLSALTAFGLAPMIALRLTSADNPQGALQLTAVVFIITVIVWMRHHENIKRLFKGTESKISFSKKSSDKKEGAA
ncbi:MAG: glycerol-3-phosphate 1-O-acyltransferase [Alphaproteobacteria bacterium]|nr:MAG: glycerol-3-phosphate 1-O-acyltransferase [Alphaproteobacteria bacterium]